MMYYRIWRSIRSDFVADPVTDLDEETCHADEIYTDAELKGIADNGFNGIWVHTLLYHVGCAAPFEQLSPHAEVHQRHLRNLCERAKKFGIHVFLYAQPLRAIPKSNHEFWSQYQSLCGGTEFDKDRALCISTPIVKNWLADLSEEIAAALPDLGGLILITASELPSHCYHGQQRGHGAPDSVLCLHCAEREPEDIVADLLNGVRNGIRRVSLEMEIIAWDWSWTSWHHQAPFAEIQDKLSADITIMADFERGGHRNFWKHPGQWINEYCLAYAGPSEDCRKVISFAQARGAKTLVKLQLGTTHELASVVSLPLITNIYQKIAACKQMKIDGFMGCWNFGSFFSANTAGAEFFLSSACPDNEDEAVKRFAESYFGSECDCAAVADAYKELADAMFYFPFSNMFIYNGPINYALAYSEVYRPGMLSGKSCGPSHLYVAKRGDDLKYVFDYAAMGYEPYDCFTLEEVLDMMPRLVSAWNKAAHELETALRLSHREQAVMEVNNALLIGKVWESTLHAFQSYALRLNWSLDKLPELRKLIRQEVELCRSAVPLLEKDQRQGWHGEAHEYLFNPEKIDSKIVFLNGILSSSGKDIFKK